MRSQVPVHQQNGNHVMDVDLHMIVAESVRRASTQSNFPENRRQWTMGGLQVSVGTLPLYLIELERHTSESAELDNLEGHFETLSGLPPELVRHGKTEEGAHEYDGLWRVREKTCARCRGQTSQGKMSR